MRIVRFLRARFVRWVRAVLATVLVAGSVGEMEAAPIHRAVVERVEWEVSDTGARIVIVVKGRVDYSTHTAGPVPQAGLPPRAYVDLKPARLGSRIAREPIAVNDRLVRRIRIGQFDADTARVVVDLAEPAYFHVTTAERPSRLILKLVPPRRVANRSVARRQARGAARGPRVGPARPASPLETSPPARTARATMATAGPVPPPSSPEPSAPPTPTPTPTPTLTPTPTPTRTPTPTPTPRRVTIVIDPGHGGKDPGARGVSGDREKDITLAIAREVAERLRADPAIEVLLTRSRDETVPLGQRTAFANAQGADLFLSIHANASESPAAAGIETYTLNNTDDQATIRLAALENGLALTGVDSKESDLAVILSDLLQAGKEEDSIALAEAVQGGLVRYLRGRWRRVSDLGVKKGPFYVLVGAYMPCVLVEVGFLTHPTEGQRLASPRYQKDLAEGIRRGIQSFLASTESRENL